MYSKAYIEYLAHFHGDRDYFECHEILEEYWKEADPGNKNSIWVALILLAVSCYHHRRGNFKGALRTLRKALTLFSASRETISGLGIDPSSFFCLLKERQSRMEKKDSFQVLDIPLNDQELIMECTVMCKVKGFEWKSLEQPPEDIVHRHLTRDRSDVIREREQAIQVRKA